MIELYTEADMARFRRRAARQRLLLALVAGAGLAACLLLIALTSTGNAARMELATIAVSTLAGWVAIYVGVFGLAALRREQRHALMLRSEPRQAVRGTVALTDEWVTIRKSITARRVEVRGEGELQRLLVCQARAAALEGLGEATLYAVHGYVAAYEVTR